MDMQEFVKQIVVLVVTGLATALAGFIMQRIYAGIQLVKAKVSEQQQYQIYWIVSNVVKAAEQLGITGALNTAVVSKKTWAIRQVQAILKERGMGYLSVEELETLIESIVLDQFGKSPLKEELEKFKNVAPSDS